MKKLLVILLSLLMVAGSFMFAGDLYAIDYGIGLIGYYAWWTPAWRGVYTDGIELEPDLLWGFVFTMSFFERWSLGLVYLQNRLSGFNGEWGDSGTGPNGEYFFKNKGNVHRQDVDLSLTYAINQFIKVYLGLKFYSFFCGERTAHTYYVGVVDQVEEAYGGGINGAFTYVGLGPGLGLTLSYPLADALFVSLNTSFIYFLWNEFAANHVPPPTVENNYYGGGYDIDAGGTAYGFNSVLMLSYYIQPLRTSVVLGGRFQYLKYQVDTDEVDIKDDIIYGVTLSAIFYF